MRLAKNSWNRRKHAFIFNFFGNMVYRDFKESLANTLVLMRKAIAK